MGSSGLPPSSLLERAFWHIIPPMKPVLPRLSAFLVLCAALPAGLPAAPVASVQSEPFGATKDGVPVQMFILRNTHDVTVKIITYGGIIYSVEVPDKEGKFANITANRETVADYEKKSACFGALLGRFANRIANGKFTLDGKEYQVTRNAGPNHIHGGARGFDKCVWQGQAIPSPKGAAVRLVYDSKDGEEGYPGALTCTVDYELSNENEFSIRYSAVTTKPTVINLSNHAYWNLAGAYSGNILDHILQVNADKYLLADGALIPTGELAPVEGTPVDFRSPHRVGERIADIKERQFNGGYDHCLVINRAKPGELVRCALLKDPKSGRTMEVSTTEPGVQLYSANFADGSFTGPAGYSYPRHLGLCLETQHFPDSPNKPQFPSTVLRPGVRFSSITVYRFGVEK
jgi:aldose 1-epimerase